MLLRSIFCTSLASIMLLDSCKCQDSCLLGYSQMLTNAIISKRDLQPIRNGLRRRYAEFDSKKFKALDRFDKKFRDKGLLQPPNVKSMQQYLERFGAFLDVKKVEDILSYETTMNRGAFRLGDRQRCKTFLEDITNFVCSRAIPNYLNIDKGDRQMRFQAITDVEKWSETTTVRCSVILLENDSELYNNSKITLDFWIRILKDRPNYYLIGKYYKDGDQFSGWDFVWVSHNGASLTIVSHSFLKSTFYVGEASSSANLFNEKLVKTRGQKIKLENLPTNITIQQLRSPQQREIQQQVRRQRLFRSQSMKVGVVSVPSPESESSEDHKIKCANFKRLFRK